MGIVLPRRFLLPYWSGCAVRFKKKTSDSPLLSGTVFCRINHYMAKISTKKRKMVLVALSGGVDSAVSAYLLKKKGYDVMAVYFDMLGIQEDYLEAKKIAQKLDVKLIKKDIRKEFKREVVQNFVQSYRKNQTPNPCVICNPKIKFSQLAKLADKMGIKNIATGHYARIQKAEKKYLLKKGVDNKKDQSYFLYRLDQEILGRTIFPLGGMKKDEVKKIAYQNRLPVSQGESQNVCFFRLGETLEKFLAKHFQLKSGLIQDENDNVLGEHKGLAVYTQGQRFGLGLSGGPYYVIGKKSEKNVLLVSRNKKHPLLNPRFVQINQVSWVCKSPIIGKEYKVKSRYQIKETPAKIIGKTSSKKYLVEVDGLQWALATGQSLVFYEGDKIIGGGVISKLV